MRLISVGFGIAVVLASVASAAAPQGGAAGNKGDSGGKGGLGPENSTAAGAGGSSEESPALDTSLQGIGGKSTQSPDQANIAHEQEKPWEVSAAFETHRLLQQNYVADGLGQYKTFNVLFLAARYSLTDNDIVTLSGGGYQFFLADQTESGFRAADLSLSYTHLFQLPARLLLRTTGSITAPISYDSQLASNITTPSLSVSLSRRFGDLLVTAGLRGSYFWDRYTSANSIGTSADASNPESGSGQPNAKWSAGGYLSAEYAMPFHRALSLGAALTDGYTWFYNVGAAPAGTAVFPGATTQPNIDNNPFQQSYGGEIFARYIIPDLSGFKSDLTLALANGDPSLGYPTVLHDGVVHPYLLYYNSAEVYFALEGRY